MPDAVDIRRPQADEWALARHIAEEVMGQVYLDLLGGRSLAPPALEPWADSWIVMLDDEMVGVGRSHDDLVSDLWLLTQARGHRIGSRLLALLETEIRERGHTQARLRVVASNTAARGFYRNHGWYEADRFNHETLGFSMLNMYKRLTGTEGETP